MIDAHTAETLRLRTAALHRISRTNDELRAEIRDREATEADVRARLADAERERDELRAKVDNLLREAEAWSLSQPPLFNGSRFPATVQAADLRAVLDGGR